MRAFASNSIRIYTEICNAESEWPYTRKDNVERIPVCLARAIVLIKLSLYETSLRKQM